MSLWFGICVLGFGLRFKIIFLYSKNIRVLTFVVRINGIWLINFFKVWSLMFYGVGQSM